MPPFPFDFKADLVGEEEHDKHIPHESDSSCTMHGHSHGYAPIGVMGDHTHPLGELMFSYRYMFMEMDGNRDGSDRVGTREVLNQYMVAPKDMKMIMHMFSAMYAAHEDLTLMAMVPYVRKSMNHVNRMGARFKTVSDGMGDVSVSSIYKLTSWSDGAVFHGLNLNMGVSLPTGSIDEEDDTPAGPAQKLPYPMQLGSGTFDLLPGLTYTGRAEKWSWGAQTGGTLRLGNNQNHYRLGNRYRLTTWGAHHWTETLSTSLRIAGEYWGNIHGADPDLNPMMVPTADPDRRAGKRVDLLVGINFQGSDAFLPGHRLSVEVGAPIYQHLDGPQLETDWLFTVGWQFVF